MKFKHLRPSDEVFETLSVKEKNQLNFLIGGNISLLVMLVTFMGMMFIAKSYLVACAAAVTNTLAIVSLILIRKGKVKVAGMLTTVALLFLISAVHFGGTYWYENGFVAYRNAYFFLTLGVCNQIMSVDKKQDKLYTFGAFAVWVIGAPFAFKNSYLADQVRTVNSLFIATFALLMGSIIMLIFNAYNNKLVDDSTEQSKKIEANLEKIKKVIEESKEGLSVGYKLKEESQKAKENSNKINELSEYLKNEATNLTDQVRVITNENQAIVEASMEMKAAVEEQNASTSNTSAALNQISANLSSISRITENRKEGLNKVVLMVESQGTLLKGLAEKIKELEKSCNQIGVFVKTVNDIQSQTNILAMNASIEAAHAGEAGKGFSVIAQEVRKLSEETSKNAALIEEALKVNNKLVVETTEATDTFMQYSETSAVEITNTVRSIDEIVSGIGEVDMGTQDIMNSLNEIVKSSQDSNQMVQNVVDSIHVQSESVTEIDSFVKTLSNRVDHLNEAITIIDNAINEIDIQSDSNVKMAEKLNESLQ